MEITIARLGEEDIDAITVLEAECFSEPWPRQAFVNELTKNPHAVYLGAFCQPVPDQAEAMRAAPGPPTPEQSVPGQPEATQPTPGQPVPQAMPVLATPACPPARQLVGYAGLWLVAQDEGHITNVAVADFLRRRGIGVRLMQTLMQQATTHGVKRFFLEVRAGNTAAQQLYGQLGFCKVGERPRYYPSGEDAWILKWELSQ